MVTRARVSVLDAVRNDCNLSVVLSGCSNCVLILGPSRRRVQAVHTVRSSLPCPIFITGSARRTMAHLARNLPYLVVLINGGIRT